MVELALTASSSKASWEHARLGPQAAQPEVRTCQTGQNAPDPHVLSPHPQSLIFALTWGDTFALIAIAILKVCQEVVIRRLLDGHIRSKGQRKNKKQKEVRDIQNAQEPLKLMLGTHKILHFGR